MTSKTQRHYNQKPRCITYIDLTPYIPKSTTTITYLRIGSTSTSDKSRIKIQEPDLSNWILDRAMCVTNPSTYKRGRVTHQ
jgi:hypothetical protein